MSYYKIEKDPAPLVRRKYPIDQLKVGESFKVPPGEGNKMRNQTKYYAATRNKRFSVRWVWDGYRCTRTF